MGGIGHTSRQAGGGGKRVSASSTPTLFPRCLTSRAARWCAATRTPRAAPSTRSRSALTVARLRAAARTRASRCDGRGGRPLACSLVCILAHRRCSAARRCPARKAACRGRRHHTCTRLPIAPADLGHAQRRAPAALSRAHGGGHVRGVPPQRGLPADVLPGHNPQGGMGVAAGATRLSRASAGSDAATASGTGAAGTRGCQHGPTTPTACAPPRLLAPPPLVFTRCVPSGPLRSGTCGRASCFTRCTATRVQPMRLRLHRGVTTLLAQAPTSRCGGARRGLAAGDLGGGRAFLPQTGFARLRRLFERGSCRDTGAM